MKVANAARLAVAAIFVHIVGFVVEFGNQSLCRRHHDVAGRPFLQLGIFPFQRRDADHVLALDRSEQFDGRLAVTDACAQWVFDLAASIFGAYDSREGSDTEGRRLITEWFVLVPKKNSKSTVAAAIMLTALIRNWRESAEFTILAPTLEVANNSFAPARDMVRKDEALEDLMQVQTHVKTITSRQNNGTLKVSAADSNTVSGKKLVGTLIEELWLFGKQANAENMLREATGGLASRPEAFVIYITTQSDDPPAGVFLQKLQYARDVRDGVIIDKQFVPIIYEYPDDIIKSKQDRNPVNFGMVNPNINYSVDRDFLEREMRKAEVEGEHSVRGFLAKHLNVEIGLMLRSNRWAGANHWEAQALPALSLEELIERCEVIDLGIDGGGLDDLLGLAAVGRCKTTRQWFAWTHAWSSAKNLVYLQWCRWLPQFAAANSLICESWGTAAAGTVQVQDPASITGNPTATMYNADLVHPKNPATYCLAKRMAAVYNTIYPTGGSTGGRMVTDGGLLSNPTMLGSGGTPSAGTGTIAAGPIANGLGVTITAGTPVVTPYQTARTVAADGDLGGNWQGFSMAATAAGDQFTVAFPALHTLVNNGDVVDFKVLARLAVGGNLVKEFYFFCNSQTGITGNNLVTDMQLATGQMGPYPENFSALMGADIPVRGPLSVHGAPQAFQPTIRITANAAGTMALEIACASADKL